MVEKKIYELITYDNYRDTKLGVNGDDSVDLFIQQGKRIKELQENNETLKRSRAHFKKVAENVTYLLKKLNKFIGEPQTQELNYYKVIEDTKNYIEELKQSQNQKAIEELKKLKTLLEKESKENPIVYDIDNDLVAGAIDRDTCFNILNKQIKSLKGEK